MVQICVILEEMSTIDSKPSPMMEQWHACKASSEGSILLFRLGDFYESFYEDAHLLAKELEITLTKRQEIPMAGIPFHTAESYIDKLIAKGYSVAIAEQMEDPKNVKGLVKREVVRTITPATVVDSSLISDKVNRFLASIAQVNRLFGLGLLDLTTSEFVTFEFATLQEVIDELYRVRPKELLLGKTFHDKNPLFMQEMNLTLKPKVQVKSDAYFEHPSSYPLLISHFKVQTLDCFGLKGKVAAINAAGAILRYLAADLNMQIAHIQTLFYDIGDAVMHIDKTTQKHLELTESLHEHHRSRTLLGILDDTETPMGGRLLKKWLLHPLLSVVEIQKRQEAVQFFLKEEVLLKHIKLHLKEIRDLERLSMRIETAYATPRDLLALSYSLEHLAPLSHLIPEKGELLKEYKHNLALLLPLAHRIGKAIHPNPPLRLSDGDIFQKGYDAKLDALKAFKEESAQWLTRYQTDLREQTGIKTLKVSYTQAFGYYIEVSKGQSDKVPSSFQRRQTLVNSERFLTEELKNYEYQVLNADEKIKALEYDLFHALRKDIALVTPQIRKSAKAVARIDVLTAFASVAKKRNWIRPTIDDSPLFDVKESRHPVLEAFLPKNTFIPNDFYLDGKKEQLILLTGPNMAGKSTYIRQAALLAILSQIGSCVPASHAHLGIIDKVFTRIGASDDLTQGQSTFMVEMAETANILLNATDKSLVILDEIGRGTSTYDGIAIAWAIAEYLLTTPFKKAKTLFATHYFELTSLEQKLPGAVNYSVKVDESCGEIVFLHQIARGSADRSYGIHVAKLAGLPNAVILRATEILGRLEKQQKKTTQDVKETLLFQQLSLFDV